MARFSRRKFLSLTGHAALGVVALSSLPPWARRAIAAGGVPPGMIVRNDYPESWETSLPTLDASWITPNDSFFVHSHFPVPTMQLENYRLEVMGQVQRPFSITLRELMDMPPVEAPYTLECAGNGRSGFALPQDDAPSRLLGIPLANPFSSERHSAEGTPWGLGAVGNAQWVGTKLSMLLDRAGLRPGAEHVWFEAADQGEGKGPKEFLRSIPMRKALDDVMLAYKMNGASLPVFHGGPVRAIVPGWYAMASTKWVTRIRVESRPCTDYFMTRDYQLEGWGMRRRPLAEMAVKSLITAPLDGARIETGTVRFEGYTWAGPQNVRIVEVSLDGGKSWQPAGFMTERFPNAWRRWATEVEFEAPGTHTVMARATDGRGEQQPLQAQPNKWGYANNSIQKVTFTLFGEPKKEG